MELDLISILIIIVLGGLVGWAASAVVSKPQGTIADIVSGIVGAFIGHFLFDTLGAQGVTGFNLYSLMVALIGAIVLLLIVRLVR